MKKLMCVLLSGLACLFAVNAFAMNANQKFFSMFPTKGILKEEVEWSFPNLKDTSVSELTTGQKYKLIQFITWHTKDAKFVGRLLRSPEFKDIDTDIYIGEFIRNLTLGVPAKRDDLFKTAHEIGTPAALKWMKKFGRSGQATKF